MRPVIFVLLLIASNCIAADLRQDSRCYQENAGSKTELSPVALGAANKLCEKWQSSFEKISWQILNIENRNILDAEEKNISYEIGDLRSGRIWVRVNNKANSRVVNAMIWFRVRGYLSAWTVKRDIPANSILHESDVIQQLGDVTTANLTNEQMIKQPEGMYARKALRKGQMISTENVSEPPLIAQNQKIQILVKNSSLQITAKAIALSSGWHVGDVITVLVNGASEKTEAIVSERGWAYVSN